MKQREWEMLNKYFHHAIESPKYKKSNHPPYYEQAMLLNILAKNNIINLADAIDWGGGVGTLAKILLKYFNIKLPVYDKYIRSNDPEVEYIINAGSKKYSVVINSAVFEHIRNRADLDSINNCVKEDGNLVLHTVVCANIPKDPDWFYLLPVHCSFYTNKSMAILMKQWGYISSLYCPSAKS